jgi:hypothetical protein
MLCKLYNMLIHEGEVLWITIYSSEILFCPTHKEALIEYG